MKYKNLADRIMRNTAKIGECWCWTLARNEKGYGRITIRIDGKPWSFWVHRVAWELFKGERIPDGMTLDHKWPECQHKHCWRPDHMEVVSVSTNTRRAQAKRRALYRSELDARIQSLLDQHPA